MRATSTVIGIDSKERGRRQEWLWFGCRWKQQSGFFAERTRGLVLIKAKKELKTLSKITSGRTITEPEIKAKNMEHVSAAAAPKQRKNIKNQKLHTTSTKNGKSPKCGNKRKKTSAQSKGHSQEHGPSNVQPIDNTSSRQYFLSEDSEDVTISEKELCCICKMFTPHAVRNSTSLIFVKWVHCDKCRHWVHLNYCTDQSSPDRGTLYMPSL